LYHLLLHNNLEDIQASVVPAFDFQCIPIKSNLKSVCNSISFVYATLSASVWHSRLGHLSDSKLNLLHDVLPAFTSGSNKIVLFVH
jgi:hypothetical protein